MIDSYLEHSFLHFFHMDLANASIHMTDVRFSPLTFQAYKAIYEWLDYSQMNRDELAHPDILDALAYVKSHLNQYELDKGR